jgi:hypothetical protein
MKLTGWLGFPMLLGVSASMPSAHAQSDGSLGQTYATCGKGQRTQGCTALGLALSGGGDAQVVVHGISDPAPPDQTVTRTSQCSGRPVAFTVTLRRRPAQGRVTLRFGPHRTTLPAKFMGGLLTEGQLSRHVILCGPKSVHIQVEAIRWTEDGTVPTYASQSVGMDWNGKLAMTEYHVRDTP